MKFCSQPIDNRTIVHADDYGITPQQSQRILDCLPHGLNSLSVMVTSPHYAQCVQLLREFQGQVRVGLHVNLVEGPCAADKSEVPLLVDENGVFKQGFGSLLVATLRQPWEMRQQMQTEIGAQLDLFLREFPQMHEALRVDSHQHFHMIPLVFDSLVGAVEERDCTVEYMRVPAEPLAPFVQSGALALVPPINWVKQAVLNTLWQFNKNKVPGLRQHTAVFCGIAFSGCMTRQHVGQVMQAFKTYAAEKGMELEFLFHPGGVDKVSECLNPTLSGFVKFYQSLGRPREAQAITAHGKQLNQPVTPKLSVLVPIYNAQPYLRECLDSLVGQTLRNIEIICINDGSTDDSAAIINEYAARDGRIRVITKQNTGYGDSMNKGLAAARGEWVGICEPDDFCDKRMFQKLVRAAERTGADIAKANYSAHDGSGKRDSLVEVLQGFPYGRAFSPREDLSILFTDPTIWAAVYRRSMLEEGGVSFSPTPGASFQDASFAHQCWTCAQRVVLLPQGLYHYRIDNAASSVKSGDKVYAVCDEYDHSFEFLAARGHDELHTVGPWLNVIRFGAYVWNYNRIAPEHHLPFAKRWVSDIVNAYEAGLLDTSLFSPGYRDLLGELLDNPQAFCEARPAGMPWPAII